MQSALELFLRSGVGGCRIEDLLERSGASSGSFYHHFGSKQAVAAELYLEILAEFHEGFLAEMHSHRSARAGIQAVVRHHLAWVADNPKRAAFLFECREPEVFPLCRDQDKQMRRAFLAECLDWLERAAAKGELRKLAPVEFDHMRNGLDPGQRRIQRRGFEAAPQPLTRPPPSEGRLEAPRPSTIVATAPFARRGLPLLPPGERDTPH